MSSQAVGYYFTLRGLKVGTAGVDMEMGAAEDLDHGTLGRAIESIFRKIENGRSPRRPAGGPPQPINGRARTVFKRQ
jgi:hypothetical protein